jgi:hypothetical protein
MGLLKGEESVFKKRIKDKNGVIVIGIGIV